MLLSSPAALSPVQQAILTPEALTFLERLHAHFAERRTTLLEARRTRQQHLDAGELPDFLNETKQFRADPAWRVAPIPADLQDRRVEITGPVDRKMVINALNSGASCFMADFEDSSSPVFGAMLDGQQNLKDAVRRTISYTDAASGKNYHLHTKTAVLMVRPRGWHLEEKHLHWNGNPASGSLVDFGLFLFHNAADLQRRGTGAYFYLPKLEHYLEARLWEDVIRFAEEYLGLPKGFVRVTVLIETILAAFQMEEILFELKDHIVGLNCGRWDYIFSFIKKFNRHKAFVLPDRQQITMTTAFLRGYSRLLINTCHRRGAHAMGGMAAQIPIKNDPIANDAALAKVRADKEREAGDGHDGTWVAHPALVPVAQEIFDRLMPQANQHHVLPDVTEVTRDVLLQIPTGTITEAGLRGNIEVSLHYLAAWLNGQGCVPIHNLMEDAATAEIARAQIWQWRAHGATLVDGRIITDTLVEDFLKQEYQKLVVGTTLPQLPKAMSLFRQLTFSPTFYEFLTIPGYAEL